MKSTKPARRGLGRGLSALMADLDVSSNSGELADTIERMSLPIEQIVANPDQPRRTYDAQSLRELAASLKSRGVLQPLIVRPHPDGADLYQIVAGERRWRAAQLAQLHELPVIVRHFDDNEMLEVALIENIQRADLNAIEEAASFRQLMDRFGNTQEELAETLHKSRSHVANLIRLLNLPDQVQSWVKEGRLTAGHARALVTSPNATQLGRRIIEKNLSVRQTEDLVRRQSDPKPRNRTRTTSEKDADTRALESDLSAQLKMQVEISHAPNMDGGKVSIKYKDLDELDLLCRHLSGQS